MSVHAPLLKKELLEGQPERELEGAGAALLEQRTKTSKALIQHGGGLKERWTEPDYRHRIREIGVVEHIERVRSKEQIGLISEWDLSRY